MIAFHQISSQYNFAVQHQKVSKLKDDEPPTHEHQNVQDEICGVEENFQDHDVEHR